MIDWEMQEQGRKIIPMLERPALPVWDDSDISG